MGVIDSRGRLFGRINIVDFGILLLLVVSILIGVVFVINFVEERTKEGTTYVLLEVRNVPVSVAQKIQQNDLYVDKTNKSVAKLLEFGIIPTGDVEKVNLILRAVYKVRFDAGVIQLQDDENTRLLIGDKLEFKTTQYHLDGRIRDLGESVKKIPVEWVTVLLEVDGVSSEVVAKIRMNDSEFYVTDEPFVQLIDIDSFPISNKKYKMMLTLRYKAYRLEKKLLFKGREIVPGRGLRFDTKDYSLRGEVIGVGSNVSSPWNFKNKTIQIELVEQLPFVAQHLQVGQQEIDPLTGRIFAEMLSKDVRPRQKVGILQNGEVVVVNDPLHDDITVTLQVLAYEQEGTWFYKNKPLLVNTEFSLQLSDLQLKGIITSIS